VSEAEALELALRLYGLQVAETRGRLMLKEPPGRSPAGALGLREGDFLLTFGGREMKRRSDLARAILETRFQTAAPITIQRGRTLYRTTLER
jgi:S1-C subfamily serine protease